MPQISAFGAPLPWLDLPLPHPPQTSLAPSLGWHPHPGQERKAQPLSPVPQGLCRTWTWSSTCDRILTGGLPLGVVVSQKSSACLMHHLSGLTLPVFSECLAIGGCTCPHLHPVKLFSALQNSPWPE